MRSHSPCFDPKTASIPIRIDNRNTHFRIGFKSLLLGCRYHFFGGREIDRLWPGRLLTATLPSARLSRD